MRNGTRGRLRGISRTSLSGAGAMARAGEGAGAPASECSRAAGHFCQCPVTSRRASARTHARADRLNLFSLSADDDADGRLWDVSCTSFDVQKDDSYTGRRRVAAYRRDNRVAVEQKLNTDSPSSSCSRSQRGPSRRCTTMSTVDSTSPEVSSRTCGIVS